VTEYVIPLPWRRPPLTLNSRVSKIERWRLGNGIKLLTKKAAAGCIPREVHPITAELVWYPGNNKVADSDNIALTLKYCVDALVELGVMPDDRPTYVVRTSQRVIPRALDPYDRREPAMFLVVNTCTYADMPHYAESLVLGQ
jgi:hypothetical protein